MTAACTCRAQQVGHDALNARGLLLDVLNERSSGMALRQIGQQDLRQAQHGRQRIVDLVRNPGAE